MKTMKSKIWMYATGAVMGIALASLAHYCDVPLYWRLPACFIMGTVVGIAWHIPKKGNNENNGNTDSN
jgi:hypothetical protein